MDGRNKSERNFERVSREVTLILNKVKNEGDRAVQYMTQKFDRMNLTPKEFIVSKKEMQKSYQRLSSPTRNAMLLTKRRVEFFHKSEQKQIKKKWISVLDGISIGQIVTSINSVGIYIPGGRYCYPSTVFMTCIPAKIAGVKEITIVTPPKNLKDEILAAAYLCGVDRVYRVGGPAAIAALAFGTHTIQKVQKIFGPGNQYVTEAKRQLFGKVGIDGIAGPSEIVIWADSSAVPSAVILNLLAQAEHDPQSSSWLLTQDKDILDQVRRGIPGEFLNQMKLIWDKNAERIIKRINEIAPEHLLLAVRNPKRFLSKVKNAGAIFLGVMTPVALGDYVAGPSHVLPTGGSAKFSSGLSVKDFLKWSSVTENRSKNARRIFNAARTMAEVEGLHYHSLSLSS